MADTFPSLILYKSCDQLKKNFLDLQTPRDVAELLEVPYKHLAYYLYQVPEDYKYSCFDIKKRSGGYRSICSPCASLGIIQRKLSQVLYAVYDPKPSVHGYSVGKSIVTNASAHTKKRVVLNIDLKNFFDSINFGRVRGLLIAKPYQIPAKAASVLAQICCYKNKIPQGAPTSPIISNMICSKLDSELQRFAKKYGFFYTRYADDITLSTTRREIPEEVVSRYTKDKNSSIVISKELQKLIEENGFHINLSKVRLCFSNQRQTVTGLTVNNKVNIDRRYIRKVRAILHSWETHGIDEASELYAKQEDDRPSFKKSSNSKTQFFLDSLKGKIEWIGYVKGNSSDIYI